MNAPDKFEEICKAIEQVTSPEFVKRLHLDDDLKGIEDLCWETYQGPDEEALYIDNDWDEELDSWLVPDERDE